MLLVGAIVGLLALGRLLVNLFPVGITIEADGPSLTIAADGSASRVELARPIVAIRPVAPIAYRREYQIDGSDSTNTMTFDPRAFAEAGSSPYYRFQALLREEWRYSTWKRLTVWDAQGYVAIQDGAPTDDVEIALPANFVLTIDLERPEIPRALALLDDRGQLFSLDVNRNDKYIRLVDGPADRPFSPRPDLLRWYFPHDWRPPLATLVDLLTRAAALGLGMILLAGLLGAVLPGILRGQVGERAGRVAIVIGLVAVLAGSLGTAVALFDRAPHILDAVAYTFQGKIFAGGSLWAPIPVLPAAFPTPFSVPFEGRWFVQYPPGTAAVLALGFWAAVPWLVEPLLAVAASGLIVLSVLRQYDRSTALLTLVLLATSPFLLLVAGAFLSHVPALCFAALAMYAATRYAETPSMRWAALMAAGLGLAFLTREIVAIFYGLSVVLAGFVRGVDRRGWAALKDALAGAAPLLIAQWLYLGYNAALTGSAFVLPRLLFDSRDVYGFGTGFGFYNEHTLAGGLVNAEEQLTSLTFYLAGWPFGVSLALPLLPFLTRRLRAWDWAHGSLVVLFVAGYLGYYYHGIVLGPRYYFEALPALVILTARGFIVLAMAVAGWLAGLGLSDSGWRARQAALILLALLLACNAFYFVPRQIDLYAGFTGVPGRGPALGNVAEQGLSGRVPRLDNALVVTEEWWFYTAYLAVLNCPTLDCGTVFAYAPTPPLRAALRQAFPGRDWYDVRVQDGLLTAEPSAP